MTETARPGCQCAGCRSEDRVYHWVCHDCARGVDDALDFHDHLVAGQERAEALAESHWHDDVEIGLVWSANGADGGEADGD